MQPQPAASFSGENPPVTIYCVVLIPTASKMGKPLSYIDWYPSSKSIETKPFSVMVKGRAFDVAMLGSGFDTLTSSEDGACNSAAGTVTVIVVSRTDTGMRTFEQKFTTALALKLVPLIVRYVRSPLPVKASGGDS